MLTIRQLSKSYSQGSQTISLFTNLNLTLKKGERVAIMGKSGSGKSTFLSLVSGISKPDTGSITLDNTSYSSLSEKELINFRAHHIGFVFQNFHLISYLTVTENVMLSAKVCEIPHAKTKALELLDNVGLSHRLNHLPSQLSGGEKQRVAIARALIHTPKLILADEPSGNLDEETGKAVMDQLFDLITRNGTTLILVTHSRDVANRCDKLYNLQNGALH